MTANFLVPEKEPFVCENCGKKVIGGGYLNHCPHCLWSKHVDQAVPGDRICACQGLMEPIGVIQKAGQWRIVHRCKQCQKQTIVDVSENDNQEIIQKLAQCPLRIREFSS